MCSMKLLTRSRRALVLCLLIGLAHAQSLEIIDLRYRTAPEVIPILQPLLEEGGALSGSDYKLFVRASAANVAQLRSVVQQIDRQQQSLVVSVRRADRQTIEREATAGSVVITNRGASGTLATGGGTSQRDGSNISSVRMLEGGSAFISAGQSIPVITAYGIGGGREPWVGASTSYRDVSSGFLVTPRISAERVTLDIEQQAQQVGANGQTIDTQSISTQVSGAVGQWISLGGISEASNSRSTGVLSRQYSTRDQNVEVWVKVELQ